MPRAKRGRRWGSRPGRNVIIVGVVASHACEREALVLALNRAKAIEALDCGAGAAESVTRARDLGVGTILIALRAGPAISFAAALRTATPAARAVVFLYSPTDDELTQLVREGAVGFVPSAGGLAICERALRAVHSKGFAYPRGMAAQISRIRREHRAVAGHSGRSALASLPGRQLEIAACIAEGLTNKEISARLRIAQGTVKTHVHALFKALGVKHRWEVRGALPPVPPVPAPMRTKRASDVEER